MGLIGVFLEKVRARVRERGEKTRVAGDKITGATIVNQG